MKQTQGITLIELLICLSILAILIAIALPNYGSFLAKQRANNEIRQLQRLLLLARNQAIHNEQYITVCPLDNTLACTSEWQNELSVFFDTNKNKQLDETQGEYVIRQKDAIPSIDSLKYAKGRTALVYAPTGRLAIWGGNGTFKYCPNQYKSMAKGLIVSVTGKAYLTSDIDQDNKEENRYYAHVECS
ncbi:GspH/FimT family pseudopilin [Thalassotalea fusca]